MLPRGGGARGTALGCKFLSFRQIRGPPEEIYAGPRREIYPAESQAASRAAASERAYIKMSEQFHHSLRGVGVVVVGVIPQAPQPFAPCFLIEISKGRRSRVLAVFYMKVSLVAGRSAARCCGEDWGSCAFDFGIRGGAIIMERVYRLPFHFEKISRQQVVLLLCQDPSVSEKYFPKIER